MKWPWNKKRAPEKIKKSDLVGLLPYTPTDPIVFDRAYSIPTDEEVIAALGSDFSSFEDEANDCDDFAFRAKGLVAGKGWPFAIVWVIGHVLVAWVNDKRELVWCEPQGRRIIQKPKEPIEQIII
jgi:hypothetical protein